MKKFLVLLIMLCCFNCAAKQTSPGVSAFESTPGWHKLDGRFKQSWQEAVSQKNFQQDFETIIKTTKPISNDQEKTLAQAGFVLRAKIKKIITGHVKTENVPEVANLEFVKFLELAVPMSLKE
ncbi:MAG: hypothetical protein ABH859_05565 [Pseudomonadota bacterium]